MPTENRSSNTEMVSVPRERLDALWRDIQDSALRSEDPPHVRFAAALLAQPAEHQGEPEVLFLKSGYLYHCDGKPALTDETVGYVRADQIPNADPGEVERWKKQAEYNQDTALRWLAELEVLRPEVERLQRRIQNADLALKTQTQNCDNLRDQLADLKRRHDGLHRDMYTIAAREVPKGCTVADYASAAIADALSASAGVPGKPSQP